ncbi:Uncharacterised protein [Chlamydia abortus]|nr:Uncharacterised protein [Chlamydia abortus]
MEYIPNTQIINTAYMIVMRMGEKYTIKFLNMIFQHLLTKIGTGINKKMLSRPGNQHGRT